MNELFPSDKINRRQPVNRVAPQVKAKTSPPTGAGEPVDRVTLSGSAKETGKAQKTQPQSEIRHDIVNKFRKVLEEGDYVVKANEIADKIVQKIRESKNHTLLF